MKVFPYINEIKPNTGLQYFSMIYCLPLQISNANNEHFSNVKFIAFYLRVGTKKLILNLIAFAPKNNIFLTSIEIIWYE